MHSRRLTEQHIHRQINGLIIKVGIRQLQMVRLSRFAHHGIWTTFTSANGVKPLQILWRYRHDITFLGFVTPDFQRRHARLIARDIAQLKAPATTAIFDQLRHGVGQTTSPDVVDKGNRIVITQLPATIDHFLATALHFRVFTLDRCEVQILMTATGVH